MPSFPTDGEIPTDEFRLLMALFLTPGFGPTAYRHLIGAFGSPEGIYGVGAGPLREAWPKLRPESLAAILRGPDFSAVDFQWDRCRRLGVTPVSHRSPHYPLPLLSLAAPPLILFLRGTWLPADGTSVSVVGTRYPTGYGMRVGRELCLGLAEAGMTLVSGLARGIDTMAHQAALTAGARTAAVLGSGLDFIYPRENTALAERIAEQGCLISEYPMGMQPQSGNFPRRNRLISALSLGTAVVEAGAGSGALITARYALEQGKEIFAVPGSVDNPGSRGTHQLIQEGAHLVTGALDILALLQGTTQAVPSRRFSPAPPEPSATDGLPEAVAGAEAGPMPGAAPEMDEKQRELLLLVGRKAVSLDVLAAKARRKPALQGLAGHQLLAGLLSLEMRSMVKRMPGSTYRLP